MGDDITWLLDKAGGYIAANPKVFLGIGILLVVGWFFASRKRSQDVSVTTINVKYAPHRHGRRH